LRRAYDELDNLLAGRTATLEERTGALQAENAKRKRAESVLEREVAAHRSTEDALNESERRFRLFIEAIPDYAFFMLDPHGHIINWNAGAQRILQFSADEITGLDFSRFYPEEDQQHGEPARALKRAAYEGKHITEGWRRRRDGNLFWADVAIEAIHDEVGSLVGFAQIIRDNT